MESEVKSKEQATAAFQEDDKHNFTGKDETGSEMISKSAPVALLCRLCAYDGGDDTGPEGGTGEDNPEEMKWVSLQNTCGDFSDTVQTAIRKLLPERILSNLVPDDQTSVICMACYRSLQNLMGFIEKINQGQEKLKQLLVHRAIGSGIDIPAVAVPAKRGRGRPRKGTGTSKPDDTGKTDAVLQEPRAKRPTRVPLRLLYTEAGVSTVISSSGEVHVRPAEDIDAVAEAKSKEVEGAPMEEEKNDSDSDSDAIANLSEDEYPTRKRKRGRPRRKVARERVKFQCEKCEKSYFNYNSLVYHKLTAHENKRDHKCTICDKGFNHKALLANHMFTHSSDGTFRCDVEGCNSSFTTRSTLFSHKQNIHSVGLTCEICGIKVGSMTSLIAHKRIHTGEMRFSCTYCDKPFNHRGNFNEHLRSHTREKPYVCPEPECKQGFATHSQLRNHKLIHSEIKPYICVECGKTFNTLPCLNMHVRRHKGDRVEECNICHKKFFEHGSLRKHLRIHTGERPYQCKICRKTFADPSNYAKHRKIHPQPKSADCSSTVEAATTANYDESDSTDPEGSPEGQSNHEDCERETNVPEPVDNITVNDEDDGLNILATSESLVQVLTPEALAALSQESSTADEGSVIYLYQPSDIFTVSASVVDGQSAESSAGGDGTSTIVGLGEVVAIENLGTTGTLALISSNDSVLQNSEAETQNAQD